jgi:hypothetical protein
MRTADFERGLNNVFEWSREDPLRMRSEGTERIMLNLLEKLILFMPEISSVYPKGILVCSNTQKYDMCEYGVGDIESA